ncbi:Uncharacterised protein [Candidatus Tiddalikarchaeum anstoanum]|nr:Uncharacterised protein [Candidatus Tiddalikarchaeum anstoanum]
MVNMKAKQKIYHYLVNRAGKEVWQSNISKHCSCTPVFVTKVIKELIKLGVVSKNSKNTIEVNNPFLLCSLLAVQHRLPKPVYFSTPEFEDTMLILNKTTYSIALTSAVELLNNKKPDKIHAHLLEKDMDKLFDTLNPSNEKEANLIVYPAEQHQFTRQLLIRGIYTTTEYDTYTDLLRQNNIKEALKFSKENKLFE